MRPFQEPPDCSDNEIELLTDDSNPAASIAGVWLVVREQLKMTGDRVQRRAYFMSQRSGNLANHSQSLRPRQLLLTLEQGIVGLHKFLSGRLHFFLQFTIETFDLA